MQSSHSILSPASLVPIALVAAAAATVRADFAFVEVGAIRGIEPYVMGVGMAGGMAAADYDDDGDIDLFVPNGAGVADQLYRNLGDGSFEEIAADVGLASVNLSRVALWIDYDGDHDLDLVVAQDGFRTQELPETTLRLYRQEPDGTFLDVTLDAGLFGDRLDADATHVGGLCAGDIDNDGWLDLFMTQWEGSTYLLRNEGGRFVDISDTSGVGASSRTAWQAIMHDVDGDGRLDIFMAVDFEANHLWMNQGGNTFVDRAAEAGVDSAWNEMGVAPGDFDGDGDIDFYITNIFRKGRHNRLYRNDSTPGVPLFVDVAVELGVENTDWGWGTSFVDGDRDGWVDLVATNGFAEAAWNHDPSRYFRNPGPAGGTFEDLSQDVDFDDTEIGSCLVAADFDRDGDQDLAQTCLDGPLRLLENRSFVSELERGYLSVRPRMQGTNHLAIGAVVRIEVGEYTQARLVTAGTSLMGQEPAEAFFGVGGAATIDRVRVEWPDGRVTVITDVPVNQLVTITDETVIDPCNADVDEDGTVGFADLLLILAAWGPCPPEGECPADVDEDGTVGFADLLLLLEAWGPCEE